VKLGDGVKLGNWVKIGDGVTWMKNPLAVQGTRHIVINCAPGKISIGCKSFTFADFLAATPEERTAYQTINDYTPEECAEYIRIVEFVIANGVPAAA
jgi:hypothetical protein